MKVRNLTTLLMTVSAVIVTLIPIEAFASSFPVPSPEGFLKGILRKILAYTMPATFQDMEWPIAVRWVLTGIVMALSVIWIFQLLKPKDGGSDALSGLGKLLLAAVLAGSLLGLVASYFLWAWNWTPPFGNFYVLDLRDELGWLIKIGVLYFFGKIIWAGLEKLGAGVGKGLQVIWEKVTGMADGFAMRLLGALFIAAAGINNHLASNLSTWYAPSILSSLAGVLTLLLVKNEEGKSIWSQFQQGRAAKKAAQAAAPQAPLAPAAAPAVMPSVAPPPVMAQGRNVRELPEPEPWERSYFDV